MIADTPLAWTAFDVVLNTVAGKNANRTVVHSYREINGQFALAVSQLHIDAFVNIHSMTDAVYSVTNLLKVTGYFTRLRRSRFLLSHNFIPHFDIIDTGAS